MRQHGLSGVALAHACGVSKEAVSNWLAGESVPRPNRLFALAAALHLSVEDLLLSEIDPEPLIACCTTTSRGLTNAAQEAAREASRHLRQLLPFIDQALLSSRCLEHPTLESDYLHKVASAVRLRLGVAPQQALGVSDLSQLLQDFGVQVVPVPWGANPTSNAISVYLPDSRTAWMLVNVDCPMERFSGVLARALSHCLTLHALKGEEVAAFAERFAQQLLRPRIVDGAPLDVVRARNKTFVATRQECRASQPPTTAAEVLFGSSALSLFEHVRKSEEVFRTPVYRALARWQQENTGRDPAFIAAALNLDLAQARELSCVLWHDATVA